jgi:hypothetical protein
MTLKSGWRLIACAPSTKFVMIMAKLIQSRDILTLRLAYLGRY